MKNRIGRARLAVSSLTLVISVLTLAVIAAAVTVAAVGLVQRRSAAERQRAAILRVRNNHLSTRLTLVEIHQAEQAYFAAAGCYAALPDLRLANLVDDSLSRGIKDGYMIFEEHDCQHVRVFAVPLDDAGDDRTGDLFFVLLPDGRILTQRSDEMPHIEPEPRP